MLHNVTQSEFRAGLRLRNGPDGPLFRECEVVRVTDRTVVVRCRRWRTDSWSEPFRCHDRGRNPWDADPSGQDFFVLGFGWLRVRA